MKTSRGWKWRLEESIGQARPRQSSTPTKTPGRMSFLRTFWMWIFKEVKILFLTIFVRNDLVLSISANIYFWTA